MLLLGSYLAGAPIVFGLTIEHFPSWFPVVAVFYYPLDAYINAQMPGSMLYVEYVNWVRDLLYSLPS